MVNISTSRVYTSTCERFLRVVLDFFFFAEKIQCLRGFYMMAFVKLQGDTSRCYIRFRIYNRDCVICEFQSLIQFDETFSLADETFIEVYFSLRFSKVVNIRIEVFIFSTLYYRCEKIKKSLQGYPRNSETKSSRRAHKHM